MRNLQQCRLLVVDNNVDSRELLSFVLESEGAAVNTVASAQEALELLSQQSPDVLLCGLMMPHLDGYSLIRCIRSQDQQRLQQLPAIAVTSQDDPVARQQALAAGFQDYLTKPINFEAVVAAVLRLRSPTAL